MRQADLAGKVQAVLGTITPEELGITLANEHCL
jgi:predicted metal-dependent phosphotriesterase family hydrolase